MMLSLVACGGKTEPTVTDPGTDAPTTEAPTDEPADEGPAIPTEPTGQIIIGNSTELTGDWITTFQNNASDFEILNFISGYSTVGLTFAGEYVVNDTAVEKYEVIDNADGSKTYVWTINKGLTYNNGAAITAKDYVADILLFNNKFIADLGGRNTGSFRLVGHSAYARGESNVFSGVRLIDDYTFSLTIDPSQLPYFYELPMVSAGPTYLPFWLGDGVDVLDDGEGAYFSEELTTDKFQATFEAARNNPIYVSSGAYVVDSYDEASKTAVLKVNPNFAGDFSGQKPLIETVIYKRVTSDTALDELATGSVDLLVQLVSGTEINAGFDLVDRGGFNYNDYPRAGYGKLSFVCDFGPTQFKEVRHAIGHLLDRNDFARTFTEGYGSVINGPFGEGQWFYQETRQVLNERMNQYPYSLDKAIESLEAGGWVLDANGNAYTSGIRHKKMDDGSLMPLIIEWSSSEQNSMSDLLVVMLQENPDTAAAGIQINQTVMTFGELLNYYYRDGSQDAKYGVPTYHMFNLATNFNPNYDLSKTYSTDPADLANGSNTNFILDEKLEGLAKKMVLNDAADRDAFKADFVEFIAYWNELLPDLPLYSNIYHDFFNEKLHNFNNNSLVRTSQALLYAYVVE